MPSPRANGRLACGPHGAHYFEIPSAEPPSNRSARLRPSWSTPNWEFLAPSPRANGSACLWPSWSMPRYRRFYPIFERIDHRMVTCKKITLCRAGAGRTIPASDRRPTGFAGDPRGVYLRYPSWSFDMAVEASFRSHGANQSQAGLGNRTRVVSVFGPEQVREPTKTLVEHAWCRAGDCRAIPMSD